MPGALSCPCGTSNTVCSLGQSRGFSGDCGKEEADRGQPGILPQHPSRQPLASVWYLAVGGENQCLTVLVVVPIRGGGSRCFHLPRAGHWARCSTGRVPGNVAHEPGGSVLIFFYMRELRCQGTHRGSRLGPLFCNCIPATARGCTEVGAWDKDRWGLKI